MHPARKLLDWIPGIDFALLGHGFPSHGRDYVCYIQDCLGANPGVHELVFTHCVQADCESRVRDDVWSRSWDDVFLDYECWKSAGEPEGYLWGTNWSNAYPGLTIVENSEIAATWTKRIGRTFYEITLETDRIFIRLIFHDVRHRKLSDSTEAISAMIVPLPNNRLNRS